MAGADELWGLAYRLQKRFPTIAAQEYMPKRFPFVSTQVRTMAFPRLCFLALATGPLPNRAGALSGICHI
jgi:hypothetical protein